MKVSEPIHSPGGGGMSGNDGMLLGYARVSKDDERNNALKAKGLRAAGCRKLFEEDALAQAGARL